MDKKIKIRILKLPVSKKLIPSVALKSTYISLLVCFFLGTIFGLDTNQFGAWFPLNENYAIINLGLWKVEQPVSSSDIPTVTLSDAGISTIVFVGLAILSFITFAITNKKQFNIKYPLVSTLLVLAIVSCVLSSKETVYDDMQFRWGWLYDVKYADPSAESISSLGLSLGGWITAGFAISVGILVFIMIGMSIKSSYLKMSLKSLISKKSGIKNI